MINLIRALVLCFFSLLFSVEGFATVGPRFEVAPLGKYDNGYTEARYDEILQILRGVYGPIIEARGGEFHLLTDWTDGAVNMWAFRIGDEYWLELPGGMARYGLINEEAFLTSICHELGHLLGGPPYRSEISLEGQSDYYATLECVEKLLPAVVPIKNLPEDLEVSEACVANNFPDQELCQRALQGAKSLTSYYAELEKVPFPQISTPSSVVVAQTLTVHPPAQCRLDTFVAGLFKWQRPACWFKASQFWWTGL